MSRPRWVTEVHERDHMQALIGGRHGARPWVVRDTWHNFPWPIYYEGNNAMSAVRFKTEQAAQRCADRLNGKAP